MTKKIESLKWYNHFKVEQHSIDSLLNAIYRTRRYDFKLMHCIDVLPSYQVQQFVFSQWKSESRKSKHTLRCLYSRKKSFDALRPQSAIQFQRQFHRFILLVTVCPSQFQWIFDNVPRIQSYLEWWNTFEQLHGWICAARKANVAVHGNISEAN